MTELLFGSATGSAALIRDGGITSAELVRLQLERIAAVNPALNALVEVRGDEALTEAKIADRTTAEGDNTGPLHGVPISIKEAFAAAPFRSTWGEPEWAENRSVTDATVVGRLRRAGAVLVGTSNVAQMLGDFGQTVNPVYGRTLNPWHPDLVPGGSSGGAAAAVAGGLSFLDYGSDLAGSLRIPAAMCGVYGLKASVGIVPPTGFQPPGPPAATSERAYQLGFGPLARSAADLRAALRCTAGPESPASAGWRWTLPPARHTRLRDYRVRYVLDHPAAPVSSAVGDPLSNALDRLARAGVTLTQGWPDGIDPLADVAAFGFHLNLYFAYVAGTADVGLSEVIAQEAHRMRSRESWQRCLTADADVFLCPTTSTGPFPHDDRPFEQRTIGTDVGDLPYAHLPFWVAQASLTGLPALSVPFANDQGGTPASIQVVGPLYEDDTAITFAELVADVIGGYRPPPPLHGTP